MRNKPLIVYAVSFFALLVLFSIAPIQISAQQNQNPSPMQESTRQHDRIQDTVYSEKSVILTDVLSKPVKIFIPKIPSDTEKVTLLFHFHGASYIVDSSVVHSGKPVAGLSTNLGSGSGIYNREFTAPGSFQALYDSTEIIIKKELGNIDIDKVMLSGFSAGYGAVRAILAQEDRPSINAVLLLDGIHAGYIPPGIGLYHGGKIDSTDLRAFLRYAEKSAKDEAERAFLITHSEIFPGTYVSTTEATDYILNTLRITREPVLKWGPGGMQMLSNAERGRFRVMGFAGNSAPDHMDHLHNLPTFLRELLRMAEAAK